MKFHLYIPAIQDYTTHQIKIKETYLLIPKIIRSRCHLVCGSINEKPTRMKLSIESFSGPDLFSNQKWALGAIHWNRHLLAQQYVKDKLFDQSYKSNKAVVFMLPFGGSHKAKFIRTNSDAFSSLPLKP